MDEQLKIIFQFGTQNPADIIRRIRTIFDRKEAWDSQFTFEGHTTTLSSIESGLGRSKRHDFDIRGASFEFLLGSLKKFNLDFLRIKRVGPSLSTWDEWIDALSDTPHFVMGYLSNADYEHWQNAVDPVQYSAAGRDYSHLPMKTNGLPYPLERRVIDTSANPGRWRYRDGYVEAVGAVIWLGDPFWLLTGADRARVEAASWLRVSSAPHNLLRLEAARDCFTSADGESADIQSKLRSLLFPRETTFSE